MTVPFHSACAARSNRNGNGWRGWRRGRVLGYGLLCALGAAITLAGCNKAAAPKKDNRVEVSVTSPITDDVVEYEDFTGRLDALKTAEIRARVTGYVKKIPFKEGDYVHKGDLLFLIDPQLYVADLNLAEANLKVAETDADLQKKNADRAAKLLNTNGAISEADYETALAAWEKAKATIVAMKAARDKAKDYVEYTRVVAPFDGRVSRRNVDPGNDVIADQTMLTTLVTETPVYAYFDVDERTYQALMTGAAARNATGFMPLLQSKVLMRLANEDKFKRVGIVNFLDNRVTATTGTIRMRGIFPNEKYSPACFTVVGCAFTGGTINNASRNLTPGLFARVRMPTGQPYRAFLVPDEAVQSDQGRKYVFVVNADNEVEYRSVELGQAVEGLSAPEAKSDSNDQSGAEKDHKGKATPIMLRVIKKGVSADDQVIITGMQRVKPKQVVKVKKVEPPTPIDSPLKRLFSKASSPSATTSSPAPKTAQ